VKWKGNELLTLDPVTSHKNVMLDNDNVGGLASGAMTKGRLDGWNNVKEGVGKGPRLQCQGRS